MNRLPGVVAYIGIFAFKLKGIKQIEKIKFSDVNNSRKCGKVVAFIRYDDNKIDVYMPVNGKIVSINDVICTSNKSIVLQEPENTGYIALIIPSSPCNTVGLIISEKYCMSSKITN